MSFKTKFSTYANKRIKTNMHITNKPCQNQVKPLQKTIKISK